MSSINKRRRLLFSILAVLFLIMLRPSIIWSYMFVVDIAFAVFAILLFFISRTRSSVKGNDFLLSLVLLVVLLIYSLVSNDIQIFNLLLFLIIFTDEAAKEETFKYCHTALAVLFSASLIAAALVLLGIELPSEVIDAPNTVRTNKYLQYPFLTVAFYEESDLMLMRFASVFDEPGVVGTLSALFIVLDKYNFKKWQNYIFLAAGVLSFSFFFYLVFLVYAPFFMKLKHSAGFVIVLILLLVVISIIESATDIDMLEHVLGRFEVKDGHLAGDNRSNPTFERAYEAFLSDGSNVLFGKGVGEHNKIAVGLQSYKMMIYDLGIVYVLTSLLFFVLHGILSLKNNLKAFLLYSLLLLFFYYNRPAYLYTPPYFFLFMVAPLVLKDIKHKRPSIKRNEKDPLILYSE